MSFRRKKNSILPNSLINHSASVTKHRVPCFRIKPKTESFQLQSASSIILPSLILLNPNAILSILR
ncbi:hypothetical protein CW304_29490 [Bacillus sp. UFRGS-B20]|nr:hypothetical protein CW304_29490 [Bacillus sp. UFRGS-B20]